MIALPDINNWSNTLKNINQIDKIMSQNLNDSNSFKNNMNDSDLNNMNSSKKLSISVDESTNENLQLNKKNSYNILKYDDKLFQNYENEEQDNYYDNFYNI